MKKIAAAVTFPLFACANASGQSTFLRASISGQESRLSAALILPAGGVSSRKRPLAALHDDPPFRDLLRRMNLPE